MDILTARLEAIHPNTHPQIIQLPMAPGAMLTIGRRHFGDDEVISRQHARFGITMNNPPLLYISNLSATNGVLHNMTPLLTHRTYPLNNGDELVIHTSIARTDNSVLRVHTVLLSGLNLMNFLSMQSDIDIALYWKEAIETKIR
jgi:hypothetical protein